MASVEHFTGREVSRRNDLIIGDSGALVSRDECDSRVTWLDLNLQRELEKNLWVPVQSWTYQGKWDAHSCRLWYHRLNVFCFTSMILFSAYVYPPWCILDMWWDSKLESSIQMCIHMLILEALRQIKEVWADATTWNYRFSVPYRNPETLQNSNWKQTSCSTSGGCNMDVSRSTDCVFCQPSVCRRSLGEQQSKKSTQNS